MFLSDHHPITITLTFPEYNNRTKTWRLNPSLLKDPDVLRQINTLLKLYFQENSSPAIIPITLWEKCVIRGKLIALATNEKKRHQAQIASLIKTINRLETTQAIYLSIHTTGPPTCTIHPNGGIRKTYKTTIRSQTESVL